MAAINETIGAIGDRANPGAWVAALQIDHPDAQTGTEIDGAEYSGQLSITVSNTHANAPRITLTSGIGHRRLKTDPLRYGYGSRITGVPSAGTGLGLVHITTRNFTLEWFSVKALFNGSDHNSAVVSVVTGTGIIVSKVLAEGHHGGDGGMEVESAFACAGNNAQFDRCVAILSDDGVTSRAAITDLYAYNHFSGTGALYYHCTAAMVTAGNAGATMTNFRANADGPTMVNCKSLDIGGAVDTDYSGTFGVTSDYNLGSDATGPGANAFDNVVSSGIVKNATYATLDLRWKDYATGHTYLGQNLIASIGATDVSGNNPIPATDPHIGAHHAWPVEPSITTTSLPDGYVGVPYSEEVEYTSPDIPVELSAATLPAWMSFDEETGIVSGTPTSPSSGQVFTINVTNLEYLMNDAQNLSVRVFGTGGGGGGGGGGFSGPGRVGMVGSFGFKTGTPRRGLA